MTGGPGRETTHDLEHALEDGDLGAARRAVLGLSSTSTAGEEALAVLARRAPSSPAALELLIETLDATGVIRRFAGAALVDPSAVDDVSQDALISVAQSIGSYTGQAKVTTWVHSIVRRRVVDHLRRLRQTEPLHDDIGPAQRMSSIIATRAAVRQVVADLPEIYREPVTLRDIEDLPYPQIAEQLGVAEGTVRSRVSRGRALIGAQFSADDAPARADAADPTDLPDPRPGHRP